MFQPPHRRPSRGPVDIAEPSRQNLPVRLVLTTALALALAASGTLRSQSDSGYVAQQQRMTRLHVVELVESWLDATGVPGAAVAVVEGGHTLLLEGFGLADTEREIPVDPVSTIFRVGDLARAMTASAVLQLADQGALELEADITRLAGLELLADDRWGPVTPTHLLLHTAGIDRRRVATRARNQEDLVALGPYLERRMPPRVRPPGVVSIPSAHGYTLAGRLIEVVSGDAFDSHLDATLFAPLEMSNTTVALTGVAGDKIAIGYRLSDGRLTPVIPDYPQTVPASTLLTTAADMAAWMRVILAGGSLEDEQIFTRGSLEKLLQRQFTHHESLPGRTLAFQEGHNPSRRELYLASTGNGFGAILVLLPQRRVGFFVALNREIDLWSLAYQILDPFDRFTREEGEIPGSGKAWSALELSGFWRDAAVSNGTAEKLISLVRQDRIQNAADGSLTWRSKTFDPAGPDCFLERDGEIRMCTVDGPDPGRFVAVDNLVLEKLDWYAARPFQAFLWIAFTALFLAAAWPRKPLPTPHLALRPDDSFPPRWPGLLARVAASLHFLFIASLAVILATTIRSESALLLYDIPPLALVVLTLPLVAAALTLVAVIGLGSVWRSAGRSSLGYRLRLTGLILALVAFLPFLKVWNLLGFHI